MFWVLKRTALLTKGLYLYCFCDSEQFRELTLVRPALDMTCKKCDNQPKNVAVFTLECQNKSVLTGPIIYESIVYIITTVKKFTL